MLRNVCTLSQMWWHVSEKKEKKKKEMISHNFYTLVIKPDIQNSNLKAVKCDELEDMPQGTGQMVWWLEAFAAPGEDPCSIPRTHVVDQNRL